jgi:hypothetical protein
MVLAFLAGVGLIAGALTMKNRLDQAINVLVFVSCPIAAQLRRVLVAFLALRSRGR